MRKIRALVFGGILAATSITTAAPAVAATPGVDIGSHGVYRVQSSYDFCADAPGTAGGQLALTNCANATSAGMSFTFTRFAGADGSNAYQIGTADGMCVTVSASSNGTPVTENPCEASSAQTGDQLFDLVPTVLGTLDLRSTAYGGCVDGPAQPGAAAQPLSWHATSCGAWPLGLVATDEPAGTAPTPSPLRPTSAQVGDVIEDTVYTTLPQSLQIEIDCSYPFQPSTFTFAVDGVTVSSDTCIAQRTEGYTTALSAPFMLAPGSHCVRFTVTAYGAAQLVPYIRLASASS